MKKPKDICINAIYPALSQVNGTYKIRRADNEIKFRWVRPFRKTYNYNHIHYGKILFEGDEITKVTIIIDVLIIYLGLSLIIILGIFLSIMFLTSPSDVPTYMRIRILIMALLTPILIGIPFALGMKAYYHRSERDLWFRIASKIDKNVISETILYIKLFLCYKTCPKCKNSNKINSKFCVYCGEQIGDS